MQHKTEKSFTIQEAVSCGKAKISDVFEVEVLLSNVLGKDRSYLVAHSEEILSHERFELFSSLSNLRSRGKPVAYLTRKKEFFGLDFFVDERCFIPRPETELLVELALQAARNFENPSILDIGTGSGAIAIAIAKSLTRAKITAVDISREALEVAIANAQSHFVADRIEFLESDLLKAVKGRDFDIIVANLPYIGTEEFSFVEIGVKENEPSLALFGGPDGLDIYRRLFDDVAAWQKNKETFAALRFLCLEFGFGQRGKLEELLNKKFVQQPGLRQKKLECFKDLAGIDRAFVVSFA